MDFVKKNWLYLTLGVVGLGSIVTAALAYSSGDAILEEMRRIDSLRAQVQSEGSNAQNAATIEAQKAAQSVLIAKQESLLNAALKPQKYNEFEGRDRQVLVAGALPAPASDGLRFEFKNFYSKAYDELARRLHGGPGATPADIANEEQIESAKSGAAVEIRSPWAPQGGAPAAVADTPEIGAKRSIGDILKTYPKARAKEKAARRLYTYVDSGALIKHSIADMEGRPPTIDIWHAQMTLWIQQDIVEALARVNDKRADELKAAGRAFDAWVANMPVKHLKNLASMPWLGQGGGMGGAIMGRSFTGITNDSTKFVVPLQLRLVVEEASLMEVVDSICRIGYYTPTRINYQRVEPNPMQDVVIYGNDPVIEVVIDIEGYFFRRVFDEWIPKDISDDLARPEAKDDPNQRGRG